MHVLSASVVALAIIAISCALYSNRDKLHARTGQRGLRAAGFACLVILVAVNALDWPGTVLADFWVGHAIFAATVSALPLVGVGYFIFKTAERDRQAAERRVELEKQRAEEELESLRDDEVAAAARTGLVDHLVDVDVTIALTSWDTDRLSRRWVDWSNADRPLRWLRNHREQLEGSNGRPNPLDPRAAALTAEPVDDACRYDLLDQALRRVMEGVRDWGPTLCHSTNGEKDLVALARLRHDIMSIVADMRQGHAVLPALIALQLKCREMAYRFEMLSGTAGMRPELINSQELLVHRSSRDIDLAA